MKKLIHSVFILFMVILATVQMVSAQKNDTSTLLSSKQRYDFYMQRHKTFNTLGWVLLAPGAGMLVGGVIGTSNTDFFSDANTTALVFATIGSVMMLGSIPCLSYRAATLEKQRWS